MKPHPKRHGDCALHQGADYTPEEVAYLQAVDRYRRQVKRPILRVCDYLAVLKQCGYRKVDERGAA